jgi:hypothetical protein
MNKKEILTQIDSFLQTPMYSMVDKLIGIITPLSDPALNSIAKYEYNMIRSEIESYPEEWLKNKIEIHDLDLQDKTINSEDISYLFSFVIKTQKSLKNLKESDPDPRIEIELVRFQDLLIKVEITHLILSIMHDIHSNEHSRIEKLSYELGEKYHELFGKPDQNYIAFYLGSEYFLKILEIVRTKNPQLLSKINFDNLGITPNLTTSPFSGYPRSSYLKLIDTVLLPLKKYEPKIFSKIPLDCQETVSGQEMEKYIQESLDLIHADLQVPAEFHFHTHLKTNDSFSQNFNVNSTNRIINIPVPERSWQQFRGTFYHEVLVHALRKIHSDKHGIEVSMPNYLALEEGLAVSLEQLSKGADFLYPDRMHRPIIIALFYAGLDMKTIQQIFECAGPEIGLTTKEIHTTIMRLTRGTFGPKHFSGASYLFTKDIVYGLGFEKLRTYLTQENIEFLPHILDAKFDITNPIHVDYLKSRIS